MDERNIKKIWEETVDKSTSKSARDTYRGKTHPYFAEKQLSLNMPVFKINRNTNQENTYPYSHRTIQDPHVRDSKQEILQTLDDTSLPSNTYTDKTFQGNAKRNSSDLDTMDLKEILVDNDNTSDYKSDIPPAFSTYEIEKELARGGMGVVYNARQNSLKRNVAIKQILPDSWTPSVQEKFIAEATVTAYLNHPNIPAVYDLGQAEDGDVLRPGLALLAPGGKQMMVDGRGTVRILPGDERLNYRPCVDVTFGSAAKAYGDKVLAVVLTGMGADGREGARMLKQSGSQVWAQDEASCVIYGMPMAVVKANLSDAVYGLDDIGRHLSEACI